MTRVFKFAWTLRAAVLSFTVGALAFVVIALGLVLAVLLAGHPLDKGALLFYLVAVSPPFLVLLLWVRAYLDVEDNELRSQLLKDVRVIALSMVLVALGAGGMTGLWVKFGLSGSLLFAFAMGMLTGFLLFYRLIPRRLGITIRIVITHIQTPLKQLRYKLVANR